MISFSVTLILHLLSILKLKILTCGRFYIAALIYLCNGSFSCSYIISHLKTFTGPDASIMELTDFMCAAQMAKAADALLEELPSNEEVTLLYLTHQQDSEFIDS